MKIKFKNKRLYINLGAGIYWIGFGIFNLYIKDKMYWTDYGYLTIGIVYIGLYIYDRTNQYLTIDNESIKRNGLFGGKINIKDIVQINKVYGDYTLISKNQKLKINTELIDEQSKIELLRILNQIEL